MRVKEYLCIVYGRIGYSLKTCLYIKVNQSPQKIQQPSKRGSKIDQWQTITFRKRKLKQNHRGTTNNPGARHHSKSVNNHNMPVTQVKSFDVVIGKFTNPCPPQIIH